MKIIKIHMTIAAIFCIPAYVSAGSSSASSTAEDLKDEDFSAYWSEERRDNAKPMPVHVISEEEYLRLKNNPTVLKHGEIKIIEPSSEISPEALSGPEKANIDKRPYWNAGKLFFHKPGAGDRVCSAQYVGSRHVVMTAAHCIQDSKTGVFNRKFMFYRKYENGGGQEVGYLCASVPSDWKTGTDKNNYKRDYGFMYMREPSGAGHLGIITQMPYQNITAIGYPGNHGKGRYLYKQTGTKGEVLNGVVQMVNNDLYSGSSGGAWIGDLNTKHKRGNYAMSLNSHHYPAIPNSEFGPIFDDVTLNIYGHVKAKGCK